MRNAEGIGLAAPQIGVSLRLLVVDISLADGYGRGFSDGCYQSAHYCRKRFQLNWKKDV